MESIIKFPRTHHITGSRLQRGDEASAVTPLSALVGSHIVVEEKMDGANAGVGFDAAGRLRLQSRGHYLEGGPRERHFALLKQWASVHRDALWAALGARYLMYGEWLYAKHTVYYDALPHFFMEFDLYDRQEGEFLDTSRRRALLEGSPVTSVLVLHEGVVDRKTRLEPWIVPSRFKTLRWREQLAQEATAQGVEPSRAAQETDRHDEMEGLYIKVESGGVVRGRYKFVRSSFLQSIQASESHWHARPIIPNRLAEGVDIFGGASS